MKKPTPRTRQLFLEHWITVDEALTRLIMLYKDPVCDAEMRRILEPVIRRSLNDHLLCMIDAVQTDADLFIQEQVHVGRQTSIWQEVADVPF